MREAISDSRRASSSIELETHLSAPVDLDIPSDEEVRAHEVSWENVRGYDEEQVARLFGGAWRPSGTCCRRLVEGPLLKLGVSVHSGNADPMNLFLGSMMWGFPKFRGSERLSRLIAEADQPEKKLKKAIRMLDGSIESMPCGLFAVRTRVPTPILRPVISYQTLVLRGV